VGLSYLVNLGIPRSGEIARALTLSRYEKLPFANVMGTIIAERAVDMIMLMLFILLGLSVEFDLISGYINMFFSKLPKEQIFFVFGIMLFIFIIGIYVLINYQKGIWHKLKGFLRQIIEGIFSIRRSPHKLGFIVQTVIIWLLYILMLYVVMMAFKETASLPAGAVFLAFITGSLSIVLSNGGIGTYPVFVTETLALYGISREGGFAFSITMWTTQTLVVVLFGLMSILLLPYVNRKNPNVRVNA
jgi:uncharacterized membrane protein YbhN (UPF0104 family)